MNEESKSPKESFDISLEQLIDIADIGSMYLRQGNLEKARTIFEGLVELDSELFEIQSCIGAFYTQIRDDEKAIYHLDKAISINPNIIAPYVNRAEVNIRKQDIENAVSDIMNAVNLDEAVGNPDANRARTMLLGIFDALKTKGWIRKKQTSQ
jgi:tetratricopeptide (TPR) repeat protein